MSDKTLPKTMKEYIQRIHDQTGTDVEIGRFLGFTDGSRVGLWRRGEGRPDELNCMKLARWMGDDPVDVLRIAGYTEMADVIKGSAGPAPIPFSILRPQLISLMGVLDGILQTIERVEGKKKTA